MPEAETAGWGLFFCPDPGSLSQGRRLVIAPAVSWVPTEPWLTGRQGE
jgi:hypothetical protein